MSADGAGRKASRWRRYQRPGADEIERESRGLDGRPLEPSDPAPVPAAHRFSGRRWVALGTAAAVVGGGAVFALTREGGLLEPAPEPYPREERYEEIMTADALAEIEAALEAATGSTQVLTVRIHGVDDVNITVAPEEEGGLAGMWLWDGQTLENPSASQAGDQLPFDLSEIDPAVLVALDEEARGRTDGVISGSRVTIEKPASEYDDWLQLSVTEVDHGRVVLFADKDGTINGDLVYESWRDD